MEMLLQEGFCTIEEAVTIAFQEIDKSYDFLEKELGLKLDKELAFRLKKPSIVILFGKEYTRPE